MIHEPLRGWRANRGWQGVQLGLLAVLAVILPGSSLLLGNGEFAWTMFSKSETYRLALVGVTVQGEKVEIDPRALAPLTNRAVSYFLPEPGRWRHDPVGVTFRTGLPYFASLSCRLGAFRSVEAVLEERAHLDAPAVPTRIEARCHR